jgi:N-acetylglucosaminyl-diphospho-decaprenol L-rhamnosyltransferase
MDRAESSPMATDVDVIIVSHNGQAHLEGAIASLNASRGVRANVVVVDNASVDGTVHEARRLGARVIELEDNHGYGSAANVGLAGARAAWTVVCNQDIVVDPDALARLIEAAATEERSCHQSAMMSPALVGIDGHLVETAHRLPSLFRELVGLLIGERRFGGRSVLAATSSAQHCEWVSGAFLLARRDLWQTLGGFDQGYFMYMEDVDLFDRLRAAGHHCIWVPEARVVHLGGRRPLDADLFALGLRSRQHYWCTRRGRVAGRVVLTAAIFGASARSVKWTLLSCRGNIEARAYAKMFRRAAWLCTRRSPPGADYGVRETMP